ncbi:MAG TPA: hypothetical protein VK607_15860, partial [Kofleriaceae bacterium]|nr:hypothetical protein [Kofleriaceae bacterium]
GAIKSCPPDQVANAQRQVDAARRSALYSNIAFGVAGAAAITAVIVWVTAPSLEARRLSVAPSVGPGSAGVALGGAF